MPLEVDNCCFCVELRIGSLIIGYLNLVWSFVVVVLLIEGIDAAETIAGESYSGKWRRAAGMTITIFGVSLVFVIVNIIFTILLLVGIHKHKRDFIKAYLIYTCVFILFAVFAFFLSIGRGRSIIGIIRDMFSLLFSVYFLIVVRSYYLKMDATDPADEREVTSYTIDKS